MTWVGANELMVKATDRIAKVQRVAHFVLGEVREEREVVGKVVREDDYGAIDGGWVEPVRSLPTRFGEADDLRRAKRSSGLIRLFSCTSRRLGTPHPFLPTDRKSVV